MEVSRTRQQGNRDSTSGSLHRNIWHLAIPMVLEMSLMNVSQIVDTYCVGKLGSVALAAVTMSITIRWVLHSLASGLGIGGMAVVARRVGAQDREAAEHAVWQTILLGLTVSLVMSGLGIPLARPILLLLGADTDVLLLGTAYLRVSLGGVFTLMLVFIINSLLRGAGEARLSMNMLFLVTVVTVVLEPALIFGWGPLPPVGIVGAAWATVLGYGAGLVMQVVILLRGRGQIGINLRDLKPDFPLMGQIIHIAWPSSVQMTLRSSSRMAIIGLVGAYGTLATAGYGVANRLLMFAVIPVFGLGNAAGTLVGQSLGAGKPKRAEQNAWWASAYAAAYMAVAAAPVFIFAEPLIALFDPTPQVMAFGAECIRTVVPFLIFGALGIVLARAFNGAGDTLPSMMVNLLTLWGIEVTLAYGLSRWLGMGVTGVWWGRAAATAANGLLLALWFRLGRWKRREV